MTFILPSSGLAGSQNSKPQKIWKSVSFNPASGLYAAQTPCQIELGMTQDEGLIEVTP